MAACRALLLVVPVRARLVTGSHLCTSMALNAVSPSPSLCRNHVTPPRVALHRCALSAGLVVVRFYGEHSNMWVREEDCEQPPEDETDLVRQFKSWGRQHNK